MEKNSLIKEAGQVIYVLFAAGYAGIAAAMLFDGLSLIPITSLVATLTIWSLAFYLYITKKVNNKSVMESMLYMTGAIILLVLSISIADKMLDTTTLFVPN